MNDYKVGLSYIGLQGNFEIPCGKYQPSDKKNAAEVYCTFFFVSKDGDIILL